MIQQEYNIKPVLKWVGGKKQLLNEIVERFPKEFDNYYEPFIGGGAVCFFKTPKNAHINDFNNELINLYKVIKKNPKKLISSLKTHVNDESYFYKIRSLDRDVETYKIISDVDKASRIIYLNKTCYNGLYRVNSHGFFNSPFGKYKNPLICDDKNIMDMSKYFNEQNIKITNLDFEEAVKDAKSGDFVYLDPPYDPLTASASFTSYNANGFNRKEQLRLKKVCDSLTKRGVLWMLSNSATEFIIDLYKDYNVEIVKAKRSINSKGDKRGVVDEVLITNYE